VRIRLQRNEWAHGLHGKVIEGDYWAEVTQGDTTFRALDRVEPVILDVSTLEPPTGESPHRFEIAAADGTEVFIERDTAGHAWLVVVPPKALELRVEARG
jgi:hypothetical protein